MPRFFKRLAEKLDPATRKRIAGIHFWLSIVLGIGATLIAPGLYEKILMGISFYAVTLTAADVWLTTDVREQEEKS